MIVKTLTALLLMTGAVAAHEALATHSHPHADWSYAIALVMAAGAFAALFIVPLRASRRIKDKNRDPR